MLVASQVRRKLADGDRTILNLLGAKSIRRGHAVFLQCPSCRAVVESLTVEQDGRVRCHFCGRLFEQTNFRSVKLRRFIAVCRSCGEGRSTDAGIRRLDRYRLSLFKMRKLVALHYGKRRVQPSQALSWRWTRRLQKRSTSVHGALRLVVCRTAKDFLALRVLQVLAKNEEPSFRFGDHTEFRAALSCSAPIA